MPARNIESIPLVLLAAGQSSRLGIPKGLVPWKGKPWLLHQLEAIASVGVKRVVVVLGYHADRYLSAIPNLDHVVNSDPSRGQFSSLQKGLSELNSTAAFVLPVDTPCAAAEVWESCARALLPPVKVVIPAFEGRGGHPVLLSATFVSHLLTLEPQTARLDHEIHGVSPEQISRVACADPKLKLNLNTPEDWEDSKC